MLPIDDVTMKAIAFALDGLTLRTEVISQNLSNAEVPGYRAANVQFEDQLQRAISGRRSIAGLRGASIADAGGIPGANGNTVSVEDEMVEMIKTNLSRDAMVEAYNFKADLLRKAIRGA